MGGRLYPICYLTYSGWLRNPAPVDRWFVPFFRGFQHAGFLQSIVAMENQLE